MCKKYILAACVVLALVLASGCKRQPPAANSETASANPESPPSYFQTPFHEESQFIVEAIVSDLAEQMFYAASHRLPDTNYFQVTATRKPGSFLDAPVYELEVRFDGKQDALNSEVNVNGPIWSPAVYRDVATSIAKQVGLTAGNEGTSTNTSLLSKLTDSSPETIEQENEDLSAALEKDFQNPGLHEEAAALLGAFLMRDHSGHFFEIRSPLSRLTAHLVMAQFFNGTNGYGINGQMAEAMMLTLVDDETLALERLKTIGTNDASITPLVRALWTRNTGDYRLLGQMNNLTPIESAEWFSAMADYVSTPSAWQKLNDSQQRAIDYVRIANQENYSVEMGHQLYAVALPLEYDEINNVYQLSHHKPLAKGGMVPALNEMPERCFTIASDGAVHVDVIGWGQWADFLQRHLCHAIQENFDLLQYKWGVPDEAGAFTAGSGEYFQGLRLYPFVERFDCTNLDAYHKSVDDGFKVIRATPQLVPADCWNWVCTKTDFGPGYTPAQSPDISAWHTPNPPPGTVYDLNPRENHRSFMVRTNLVDFLEKLHNLAPYDCRIISLILDQKYNNHPSYDQAVALYGNLLPYSLTAMKWVAYTVEKEPEKYEKLMLLAAQLDPRCYYELGSYELNQTNEDRAAQYYEKGCDTDPDSVRIANMSLWRVKYYLKKGQTEKAREIADFGGQVYSYVGLQAEAVFYESTSNYDQAFQWYQNIEDRYNDSGPLIDFCLWYEETTGDARFNPELTKRMDKLFPKGRENVSVADFQGPPADGVLIQEENDRLLAAGLKKNYVIVALGGRRVHNFEQYRYLRDAQSLPELDLIVWKRGDYQEIKTNPPNHKFGVSFGDFHP